MALARMAAAAPDELVCDMAETYHVLDWPALGLPLAATLAGGLRDTSRTRMALSHTPVPTDTLLLGEITDTLHWLAWTKTKDGQKGRNRPTPVLDTLLGTAPTRKATGFATAADFEAARADILRGR